MIRRPPRSTLFPYTTALPILDRYSTGSPPTRNWTPWYIVGRKPLPQFELPPLGPLLRSEEHTSELQSPVHLVCRLLLEKKKKKKKKKNKQERKKKHIDNSKQR